jgi:hypothetical protein
MEQPGFVAEQDFQTARKNHPNYATAADLPRLDRGSFQLFGLSDNSLTSTGLGYDVVTAFPLEALKENRPPRVSPQERSKFKQRTFSGKPLSDDATIQATQVASEIEDDPIIRRLFGR